MNNSEQEKRIEDLINHIDEFMSKGGGRMNIKGGDGDYKETYCHTCCGENGDNSCSMPSNENK